MTTARSAARDRSEPAGGTGKYQEKREAILVAAAQEFNQHGIRGATLAGVAGRVGLLKASVNYYYRRKEDLAADAMLRSVHSMQQLVLSALQAEQPADQVRAFLRGQAAMLADEAAGRRSAGVLFNEIRALAAPQGPPVVDAYSGLFRSIRQMFSSPGAFDRSERNARALLLLSLVNAMRGWISRFEPDDYLRAADHLGDMVIGGLARHACEWSDAAGPEDEWPLQVLGEHATREAFLRAATRLINDQGYRGASVDRICAKLNLTKGSFYHHHASKNDLVALCFERSFDVIRKTQMLAIDHLDSGWDRLSGCARALVRFQLCEQGPLLRATARSALAEAQRGLTMQHLDQLTERFGLFIIDGMNQGRFRAVDASIAARQVAAMINAASELTWWVPGVGQDNAVRLYVRPLFVGILARAAPADGRVGVDLTPASTVP